MRFDMTKVDGPILVSGRNTSPTPTRDTPPGPVRITERASPDRRPTTPARHFGGAHPLVEVATRLCRAHPPSTRRAPCGPCWEQAVRNDERLVTECGLPRDLVPDPDHVDAIAVDLACRGERVSLTSAEFTAAVTRLRTQAVPDTRIAARLRRSPTAVLAVSAADVTPPRRAA
jgi:hypothetical protein